MIERRESLVNELLTVRDYIRWGASRFNEAELYFGHGTDNAWDEATQLVLHCIHLSYDSSPEILNSRLCLDERKKTLGLIERRVNERLPLPYLTGEGWFMGLPFIVDERVLVPRSPVGELIENGFHPWLSIEPQKILDLCTGSGCIGIATALAFPDASVDVSDISPDALEVAKANIEKHQVEQQVRAVEGDLFSGLQGEVYDLIVTNPPYVDKQDMDALPDEYRKEPELALASGFDGLDFTRRLLVEAKEHLSENGVLICEVGNSWPALEEAFPQVEFTWLEFEHGGHGVFVLTRDQLSGL
ncbi:MAG: 50S ribosomal protein L3 N(5)-glutamine methyltransferase [Cellvibrionaceae bacterium]